MITAAEMIAYLKNLGCQQIRQKGSHRFFRHADGRTAVVPEHKGEDLGRGICAKILKDIEVTKDDFLTWLHNKNKGK